MSALAYPFLVAAGVGVVAEVTARTARFWLYRKPVYPLINVVVMFGLVMGALATQIPGWGIAPVTLLALAIGYGYEMANFRWLNWWHFPDNRFLMFRGEQGCAIAVACLWAAVPLMVHATLTGITSGGGQ